MFAAAVGSDSPDKQELDADLVASGKVVADLRTQVIAVRETHQAVKASLMSPAQVHVEIGEIIVGKPSGAPARFFERAQQAQTRRMDDRFVSSVACQRPTSPESAAFPKRWQHSPRSSTPRIEIVSGDRQA